MASKYYNKGCIIGLIDACNGINTTQARHSNFLLFSKMSLMSAQLVPYCAVLCCPLGMVTCKRRVIRRRWSLSPAPHMLCMGQIYRALCLGKPCTGLLQYVSAPPQPLKPSQGSKVWRTTGPPAPNHIPPSKTLSRNCTNNKVADPSHETPTLLFSFFFKPRPHPPSLFFYIVTVSRR